MVKMVNCVLHIFCHNLKKIPETIKLKEKGRAPSIYTTGHKMSHGEEGLKRLVKSLFSNSHDL